MPLTEVLDWTEFLNLTKPYYLFSRPRIGWSRQGRANMHLIHGRYLRLDVTGPNCVTTYTHKDTLPADTAR